MYAPHLADERHQPPFRLTRFFSLSSLVGVLVVTAALLWTYRALTERHLVAHESRANADMAHAFANAMWRDYRGFVLGSAGRAAEALRADPTQARLHAEVQQHMHGLQVAKIKIYNMKGTTVFSTDARQVGEDKSANDGYQRARAGEVASQMIFRESFDAFEGVLSNRNLIASYVPLRAAPGAPVEGVMEVYSDVTELLASQARAQWQVGALVLGLLTLLYLFLLMVVRKADRLIAAQEQARADNEQHVRHLAFHDILTGLPNRTYFAQRLAETLSQASRTSQTFALMFVDLDRFKSVNDSLGHEAGDELLKLVSARIRGCLREHDLLFRMGGDEFTVILPQLAAPEDAAQVAIRVREAVAAPAPVHGKSLAVGATIGIAVYPEHGDTAEALLKNADAAMYAAKESGRGRHAFFRAAMSAPDCRPMATTP